MPIISIAIKYDQMLRQTYSLKFKVKLNADIFKFKKNSYFNEKKMKNILIFRL